MYYLLFSETSRPNGRDIFLSVPTLLRRSELRPSLSRFLADWCRSKELSIISRICRTLLICFLLSIAFQTNTFAEKNIKKESAEEYQLKGYEAQKRGNLHEALTYYTKAVSISSEEASVPIFNDMGVVYEQLGLFDKAEESYLSALRLNDQYLPACSNLAYLYKNNGETARAAEYFKRRIVLGNPGDLWTQKAKEELSLLGQKSPRIKKWLIRREAEELNEKVISDERKDFYDRLVRSDAFYQRGQALTKAGKHEQAMEEYVNALKLTPQNPKIIKAYDAARLEYIKTEVKQSAGSALKLLDAGDVASAKVEFRKLLTIIPDEPILNSK